MTDLCHLCFDRLKKCTTRLLSSWIKQNCASRAQENDQAEQYCALSFELARCSSPCLLEMALPEDIHELRQLLSTVFADELDHNFTPPDLPFSP